MNLPIDYHAILPALILAGTIVLVLVVDVFLRQSRKHLTMVTLEENLGMAADIGIDATTSLDEAFAAAMGRHGPDAKVIVLPFARYQLPRNAIRLEAEPLRFPQEALVH
jgi:hypothetical protein